MKDLTAKTALVTGASGGIGRAICLALADAGAAVVACGRQTAPLHELIDALHAKSVGALAISADLTQPAASDHLIERSERELAPVDILVNNAGLELPAAFTDTTADQIRAMVEVNLTAAMLLTRRVLPGMTERGHGHVVFVSSGLAKTGSAYQAPYSATKAALIALTHALRAEYRDTRIGFSVVCPGLVTGAGMYQRMLDAGFSASPMLGTTTTTRVARKVVAAIRHDRPEVYSTGMPMRPLAAALQLQPRLTEIVTTHTGLTDLFRRVAVNRSGTRNA
jgi:short-subunit dehydrogenase